MFSYTYPHKKYPKTAIRKKSSLLESFLHCDNSQSMSIGKLGKCHFLLREAAKPVRLWALPISLLQLHKPDSWVVSLESPIQNGWKKKKWSLFTWAKWKSLKILAGFVLLSLSLTPALLCFGSILRFLFLVQDSCQRLPSFIIFSR